ncbi:16649_t:CDS:2 [Acaulospora colombiana]|uniref:16649_t:CDS:1 n=1 Tax=Acaulospora colombiana TaxID=27376 RepID=A0ACA9LG08_9GLOM|nr:16649_t:CDS:2 [Acaulospora colombiana]
MHMSLDQIYEKLNATIQSIKTSKDQALALLQIEIEKWKGIDITYRKLVSENVELRKILAETDKFDENGHDEMGSERINNKDFSEILSNRTQSISSANTIPDVFFDAEDIVLTGDPSTTDSDLSNIEISDEESEIETIMKGSVIEQEVEAPAEDVAVIAVDRKISVRRRKVLPSPVCGDDKLAEDLEYSELLDKASTIDDTIMRLIYVSAFAVSGYSSTYYRASRKPFNPLHGETYELVRPDKGPNQLKVIWKANSPIPDYEQYYGFTQFCVELNELTPDIVEYLPNTDTRFRPDQRLFEEGNLADAEAEKIRLEQKQRDFRKELESKGQTWMPQWFKLENDEWIYKGGYWEMRENKSFVKRIELW